MKQQGWVNLVFNTLLLIVQTLMVTIHQLRKNQVRITRCTQFTHVGATNRKIIATLAIL